MAIDKATAMASHGERDQLGITCGCATVLLLRVLLPARTLRFYMAYAALYTRIAAPLAPATNWPPLARGAG